MVHNAEGRDTLEQPPPTLHRRWSIEQPGDQTCQGRILFVLFSIIRVLERQSYLLSLIAMLVEIIFSLKIILFIKSFDEYRHGV